MISQPRFKWEQDCENVYKSLYEWCRKPWDVSFKLQAEIRIARASHRYPVGCVYSMTSPPFLSHPFPSPFISFNSPLPRSYLMFLLAVSLPPLFFSSPLFFCSLWQSLWWPDGGAADQNVPVPWRQSDQCGVEPRRQTLCYRRTKGTVLSMCKSFFSPYFQLTVFVLKPKCLQYWRSFSTQKSCIISVFLIYFWSMLNVFKGAGALQGREVFKKKGRHCIWVMVYV